MNKKIIHSIVLVALFVLAQNTYAQGTPTSRPPRTEDGARMQIRKEVKDEIKEKRVEFRDSMVDERMEMSKELQEKRRGFATATPAVKQEIRQEIKDKREEFRDEMKEKRDEMKSEIKEKKTQFKQFKLDQASKIVKTRLDATIVRLTSILSKIDTRIADLKTKGVSVTAMEKASLDAKTAIDNAKNAVALVVIPSTPTEDETVRASIKKAVSDAKMSIDNAQKSLTSVVKLIRASELKQTGATTTPAL